MPPPDDRVWTVAQVVLATVQAYYVEHAIDGDAGDDMVLPDAQFIADGQVAWDCPMLCVAVDRCLSIDGDPAQEQVQSFRPLHQRAAEFSIWVVRCVPLPFDDGTPPPPEAITDSAHVVLRDAQMSWNAILAALKADDFGTGAVVAFIDWTPQGPAGGLGGGRLRFRVSLVSGVTVAS